MKDAGFLRAIIDQIPSPVFVVNVKTRELELANEAAGKFREGSSCNSLLYGECLGSPPSNKCLLSRLLESRAPVKGNHRICTPEGHIVTVDLLCVPVFDGPEVTHAIHYLQDTRAAQSPLMQGQTLADLRAEKGRAQMYLDIASVVLVSLDSHGRVSLLNRKGGELLGCEPKKALGRDWFETFVPARMRETVRSTFRRIMAGEIELFDAYENPVISLDGVEKLILWKNALLRSPDGEIIGTLSSGEDITERRLAENALRESERRFRDLADQLPQTVFEADSSGRLVFANTAAFETFGYERADLERGVHILDLLSPSDAQRAEETIRTHIMRGRLPGAREYMAMRRDGSKFPVVIYSAPVTKDDEVVGLRGIAVDITERKRLEEEIIEREKMESVGRLAGGIAHDFNNMLSPILAGTSLSQHILESVSGLPPEEKADVLKLLKDVESAGVRASRLTSKLMNLSRGNPPVRQTASLAELVHETAEVVLSGSNIELVFEAPESPLPSNVDRTQMDQVISNLVTNAKYAMPSGGRIYISLSEYPIDSADIRPLKPGRYVRISIADEGTGIKPDVLPKIFEPYFTTKGKDGTGLGLATSFSIVKKHDGHLEVETEVGRGSTFNIYLPISEDGISAGPHRKDSIVPGHGRILVMDDEEVIRSLASRALVNLGYGCDCAKDGEEAVRMYFQAMESGSPYSAVILDMTVKAGMGGLEASSIILDMNPEAVVIASSGYAEGIGDMSFTEHGFSHILPKPYSIATLSKTLHKLIGGQS